jgi:ethanolamine ammonia-lyase large subunit
MFRRQFLETIGAAGTALAGYRVIAQAAAAGGTIAINQIEPGEDVFGYIGRIKGGFDQTLYRQVIGAANDFKEGDEAIGAAAADEATRGTPRPCWPTRESGTSTSTRCSWMTCRR